MWETTVASEEGRRGEGRAVPGAGGQELVCSSRRISCEPDSPGGDANASVQLADILLHRLTLVHIKNLLPGRGAVLRQELGDGRRNRAWCHVLLMKFCCDASAADLNGGRFKTSHIRLSVSALICTVISTPISTHTSEEPTAFPSRPSSESSSSVLRCFPAVGASGALAAWWI